MKQSNDDHSWQAGFFVVLLLFVAALVWGLALNSQKAKLSSQLNSANTSLSQLTSSNSQSRQNCISNAQDQAETPGAWLLPNTGSALSSAVSACQAEYPAN